MQKKLKQPKKFEWRRKVISGKNEKAGGWDCLSYEELEKGGPGKKGRGMNKNIKGLKKRCEEKINYLLLLVFFFSLVERNW